MAGRNAGAGAEVETRRDPAGPLDMSALTTIVGYPLRRAQLAVFDDFNRRFAALALSPAQFSTLALIAGALGIQRPNFVAMMDELERRGLAERLRTPADRRSRALALTPTGEALVARARRVQAEQETEIERLIGGTSRELLIAALTQLTRLAS